MVVYRVAHCQYIRDLSGEGSFRYGGRWNSKGVRILYTSVSSSLALLENIAHGMRASKEYCLAVINIPDEKIQRIQAKDLPVGWAEYPASEKLTLTGDKFVKEGKYLALRLPSVVNPEEDNVLINPAHPDFKKVKIVRAEKIGVDKRLKK